jgi:hypothetical protein
MSTSTETLSSDPKPSPARASEWRALCQARTAAKKAHDKLMRANYKKMVPRVDKSDSRVPSIEEITRAESLRAEFDAIERKMLEFLKRPG